LTGISRFDVTEVENQETPRIAGLPECAWGDSNTHPA